MTKVAKKGRPRSARSKPPTARSRKSAPRRISTWNRTCAIASGGPISPRSYRLTTTGRSMTWLCTTPRKRWKNFCGVITPRASGHEAPAPIAPEAQPATARISRPPAKTVRKPNWAA
jgi:hypothetical protein